MGDSAPALAYAAIVILGGALGGVVYLGTRTGPSTEPPASSAPTVASSQTAPVAGALTFVASADLSPEEQAMLERINQVRANPPAFLGEWKQRLQTRIAATLPCTEDPSMLDPIAGYAPQQPLAANQQLTAAARAHARDELARGFFEHVNPEGIGSNQRIIAAGYPLPVNGRLGVPFTYGAERDAVNTEALHMARSSGVTTYGAPMWTGAIDDLIVDTCVPGRGHRLLVLGVGGTHPVEPEIGIGGVTGISPKTKHSELQVVIETATKNDGLHFVLGVAFRDANANGRYDQGEGVPGVQIDLAAAGVTTKTGPGGGYALPVHDAISGTLTTAGGISLPFAVKGANVKLDVKLP